jgi:signal transduction histidine kinase
MTLLVVLTTFGFLADYLFIRLQQQQIERLLVRDLERVQELVRMSAVGARFVEGRTGGFTLQFVSQDGRVRLPPGADAPVPLYLEPNLDTSSGTPLLISSIPWSLPSGNVLGTVRLAIDVSDLFAARRVLVRSFLVSGSVIALMAGLVSLLSLRRALEPLSSLAEQADRVDPANPRMTEYQGPDDEVATVARALNRALGAIRARQQAERDALAEVAHELAAPLSVVAGQLNAVAAQTGDARLRAAKDAADELLYTSQDLLTLARGELERPLELAVVDLGVVAHRVANEYPGVRVTHEAPVEVLGNSERLTQVVRNLVRNAVQATAAADQVAINVAKGKDGEAILDVQDSGPGLSEDDLEHIFDRYYSHQRARGTGVGLTVAKQIIEQHEGCLSVQSTPGQGSCFTIRLAGLEQQLTEG